MAHPGPATLPRCSAPLGQCLGNPPRRNSSSFAARKLASKGHPHVLSTNAAVLPMVAQQLTRTKATPGSFVNISTTAFSGLIAGGALAQLLIVISGCEAPVVQIAVLRPAVASGSPWLALPDANHRLAAASRHLTSISGYLWIGGTVAIHSLIALLLAGTEDPGPGKSLLERPVGRATAADTDGDDAVDIGEDPTM
ncbi:hypothetical protein C8R44DRAFT_725730 [Mycena epipterygia]|nr:hypothetical protein C8R44DRAFT_725730 [Mycena epipterygia]